MAHLDQRPLAPLQRHLDIAAEPFINWDGALASRQLAVQPGGSLVADLLSEAGGRQHTDSDVRTVTNEVIGLTALDQIGRNAPLVGVDPVQDVARDGACFGQAFALQHPMQGLDDVSALAKLPQHGGGPTRDGPAANLDLGGEPHALQRARPLDQQRPVLPQRVEHVPVGAQVGELVATLLLDDQHAVEPREALGVDLPLQTAGYFLLGLAAQLQRDDLTRPLADTVGDIVAGDVLGSCRHR